MAEAVQTTKSEARRDRFKRIAERRVVQTIKDLRLIGNLANRNNYDYDQGDIDKIFKTLEKELKNTRAEFEHNGKKNDIEFSL